MKPAQKIALALMSMALSGTYNPLAKAHINVEVQKDPVYVKYVREKDSQSKIKKRATRSKYGRLLTKRERSKRR